MTQRIGGIFPILTQREFNTIKQAEANLLSDESFEGDTYESIGNYSDDTPLEQYSVADITEVVELYSEYFRAGYNVESEAGGFFKEASQVDKARLSEYKRGNRYWGSKLQPILKKLKRVKSRLENEALD